MSATKYETTVELPSKGLLYDGIPGKVTIRAITTNDEKLLFGSTSSNAFDKVLKNCIVTPADLDIKDLLPFDEHFLMLKLRTHTYGSEYKIQGKCPHCGHKHDFVVNLDEFPVYQLEDSFQEPIEFTLPVCEKTVSVRLLRNRDTDSVQSQAKKIAKHTGCNAKELEYMLRMAKYIKAIDGEAVDEGRAQAFVEKLQGRDSAFFWYKIDDAVKCGVDTTSEVTCPECGEEFDLPFQINSEFFRPKFG